MITLDRWREFAETPRTLSLPHVELIGLDHEPPIVIGKGEIQMPSPHQFTYTVWGTPSDFRYAITELNKSQTNPYDPLARCRLNGTDERGVNWSGGWTVPRVDTNQDVWTFRGELQSLDTQDNSDSVAREAGAETIFLLRVGDPMAQYLAGYVRSNRESHHPCREYELETLGSKIRFVYEASSSTLLVTATDAPDFRAPYAENWLGEPLRILFGQLIYPRLIARNFGDGSARVSVRPSPPLVPGSAWAALWGKDETSRDQNAFWRSYQELLAIIANDRDQNGDPNYESNQLTRLYEECILAARGSRWVWALTFASSIEALARRLTGKDKQETKVPQDKIEAIEHLTKHIQAWHGPNQLKDIAISAVRRSMEMTPVRILRHLKDAGIITTAQFKAWDKMRNAVMHGRLVSPFSTEEEDAQLMKLAEMQHALTRELLRRTSPDEGVV